VEHELKLIAELRYEPYFLTVEDIVRYARTQGILCQGRGSAANSAVCYCLGITEADPARIEVLFEHFISKERDEPPDIDVDFERGPLSRLVSIENAAMEGRTVIRPAGRCSASRHRSRSERCPRSPTPCRCCANPPRARTSWRTTGAWA
jgi:hypothetical protein